jgi:hypothetical protein
MRRQVIGGGFNAQGGRIAQGGDSILGSLHDFLLFPSRDSTRRGKLAIEQSGKVAAMHKPKGLDPQRKPGRILIDSQRHALGLDLVVKLDALMPAAIFLSLA